jgi:hypothetical protein
MITISAIIAYISPYLPMLAVTPILMSVVSTVASVFKVAENATTVATPVFTGFGQALVWYIKELKDGVVAGLKEIGVFVLVLTLCIATLIYSRYTQSENNTANRVLLAKQSKEIKTLKEQLATLQVQVSKNTEATKPKPKGVK